MAKLICGGAIEAAAVDAWESQQAHPNITSEVSPTSDSDMKRNRFIPFSWEQTTGQTYPKTTFSKCPTGLLPFQAILVHMAAVIVNQKNSLRDDRLGRSQAEVPLRQRLAAINLLHQHNDTGRKANT